MTTENKRSKILKIIIHKTVLVLYDEQLILFTKKYTNEDNYLSALFGYKNDTTDYYKTMGYIHP